MQKQNTKNKIQAKKEVEEEASWEENKKINSEQPEKIREIVKRAEVNISRWYLESARSLVVEGLALKKQDKELNVLLADIYEREKNYQNAGYIYRDMLEIYPGDELLLQKLWYVLALDGKNGESFDVYEKALKKDRGNTEILDTLAHLWLELQDYKKSLRYAGLYLKERPRDAEKLGIKWYCLEKLGDIPEAIEAYNKLLEIQPYNSEVQDRITQLTS